jgi:hypothetical protein
LQDEINYKYESTSETIDKHFLGENEVLDAEYLD